VSALESLQLASPHTMIAVDDAPAVLPWRVEPATDKEFEPTR
jgi:hypothetical protein